MLVVNGLLLWMLCLIQSIPCLDKLVRVFVAVLIPVIEWIRRVFYTWFSSILLLVVWFLSTIMLSVLVRPNQNLLPILCNLGFIFFFMEQSIYTYAWTLWFGFKLGITMTKPPRQRKNSVTARVFPWEKGDVVSKNLCLFFLFTCNIIKRYQFCYIASCSTCRCCYIYVCILQWLLFVLVNTCWKFEICVPLMPCLGVVR